MYHRAAGKMFPPPYNPHTRTPVFLPTVIMLHHNTVQRGGAGEACRLAFRGRDEIYLLQEARSPGITLCR